MFVLTEQTERQSSRPTINVCFEDNLRLCIVVCGSYMARLGHGGIQLDRRKRKKKIREFVNVLKMSVRADWCVE